MNITAIIQARMTSTRLPGKVLKTVLGKPLLEYQIERVRRSTFIDDIVIATTTNDTDDPIVEFCKRIEMKYYRGSEEDVLSRYYETAVENHSDIIIRLTSDCPIIDTNVMDQVIQYYMEHQDQYDYVSNTLIRSYPRGMDTEVFSFKVLEQAYMNASKTYEREHVTPYIYQHPDQFRIKAIKHETDYSQHRWTVDTPEDFDLIKRIIEVLYPINPTFTMNDIIELLNENLDWVKINAHIEQKKLNNNG